MTNEQIKSALSSSVNSAAGHCNRLRLLSRFAASLPENQFMQLCGQHPSTIARDLSWADADFKRAQSAYEQFCADNNLPAYQTYNLD